MVCPSRERDRAQLEQEIQTDRYQTLLKDFGRRYPFFRQFTTWVDVVAFMRNGTWKDLCKDEVLRPIFAAHSKDEDPRWRAILLAIFWSGLESIHFQRRGWNSDDEDRWQEIAWTFLELLCRVDLTRRPARLAQKILNDTVQHYYDEIRKTLSRRNLEVLAGPEEIELTAGGTCDKAFAAFEIREEKEPEIRRLREHMEAGRISDADFLLLVGTKVYGNSLADYAREVGIDYQVAKKRRQRAEARIKRFEEGIRRFRA